MHVKILCHQKQQRRLTCVSRAVTPAHIRNAPEFIKTKNKVFDIAEGEIGFAVLDKSEVGEIRVPVVKIYKVPVHARRPRSRTA